ncbi:HNH endonuclease [Shewanella sp. 10N.286.51.B2]|uniref:HNH endonuclease n=1 Tax=Shewanella sp. 10N.286.51.B2 TaxID=3229707 RepID=UPI00354C8A3A
MKGRGNSDFSESTKRTLFERVGGMCSNPECCIQTKAAHSSNDKSISVGQAAHIVAASSDGPRAEIFMTEIERKDISNGIWLCGNCHTAIDRDEDSFSTDMLQKWKSVAELRAKKNLGKKLLTECEKNSHVNDVLIKSLIQPLVEIGAQELVRRHDKQLDELDPNYNYFTDILDGKAITKATAKQGVDKEMKLNVKAPYSRDFDEQLANLENYGTSVSLPAGAFEVLDGPLLFEQSIVKKDQHPTMELSYLGSDLDLSLSVVGNDNNILLQDFTGKHISTKKCTTIEAVCLQGFFSIHWYHCHESKKVDLSLSIHMERWKGIDVNKIPYFGRLLKAVKLLKKGGFFSLEADFRGNEIRLLYGANPEDYSELTNSFISILDYAAIARRASKQLGVKVIMDKFTCSSSDFRFIDGVVNLLEAPIITKAEQITTPIVVDVDFHDKDAFDYLVNNDSYNSFKITSTMQEHIELFGVKHQLPKRQFHITGAIAVIEQSEINNFEIGKAINVRLNLSENGVYRQEFEN